MEIKTAIVAFLSMMFFLALGLISGTYINMGIIERDCRDYNSFTMKGITYDCVKAKWIK